MKRIWCVLLCLFLLTGSCLAEDLDEDYSQTEKMQRQVEMGSGLRGALKVAVTGDTLWAGMLRPLDGAEFQMRMIQSGSDMDMQMYAVKAEKEAAQTEIYRDAGNWYLKTALLMDSTLRLPAKGDLISSLLDSAGQGNPSYVTMILNVLGSDQAALEPAVSAIGSQVRSWLESFAGEPSVTSGPDGTRMRFSSTISPRELKDELKAVVTYAVSTPEVSRSLKSLMTEEQAGLLLNPDYLWYIHAMVDNLPLSGDMTYTRVVTLQGSETEARMEVPVAWPDGTWDRLEMASYSGIETYTLSGSGRTLTWIPTSNEASSRKGTLIQRGTDPFAVAYELTNQEEKTVDADDYHHETTTWLLKVRPDFSQLPESEDTSGFLTFDPIEAQLRLHYYSKSAKRSATTLDVMLSGVIPGGRVQAAAKFRTSTPWELTPLDTSGSYSLEDLSAEESRQIGQDLLANLLATLSAMDEAEKAVATATDLAGTAEGEDASSGEDGDVSSTSSEEEETVSGGAEAETAAEDEEASDTQEQPDMSDEEASGTQEQPDMSDEEASGTQEQSDAADEAVSGDTQEETEAAVPERAVSISIKTSGDEP